MPIEPFVELACPLDGEPLDQHDKTWVCPQGHSYDQARQGYVNLLPVQHKRSKDPGDSKAMVAARQRFLATGHYQPVVELIARLCCPSPLPDADFNILDAGCGEGYYLRQFAELAPASMKVRMAGLDISKDAVLAAAKQDKRQSWLVGSNAHLPVQNASLDRLLCVFGFPVANEFARVLKPGGRLIQVDPGPAHLRELREVLYERVDAQTEPKAPQLDGFQLIEEDEVSYSFRLDSGKQIQDLLAMTPHGHRAPKDGKARVAALTALEVTAEIFVRVYEPITDV
ncbi:rRNA (guanine-N1)-methyltransferase [Saccharospirillum sp. MSK14-1]|uniref:putative RNA methyltransferase n=1 Tax=Saccharospirillum sp. MSK14-1 TaxID=1897632 RepID=UPI000D3D2D37|nr:methyltransferase domain-containing protein [Saccharospirillum sp. MSK14-1]PTY36008.1 rRNA (guanine-N1)-methyltransferase [Saccharospirillum sp. MSK14-1]